MKRYLNVNLLMLSKAVKRDFMCESVKINSILNTCMYFIHTPKYPYSVKEHRSSQYWYFKYLH